MSVSPSPSVTLSEVLHLALPAGSRLVRGDLPLAGRVHWARLLRARPTGLGGVEPGELLILSSGLFGSAGDARVLGRLISGLVEAGAVAFLVAGEEPEWLLAACEESGTPLVGVPAGTALAEIERAVVGLILDRDGQLRRRAEEVYGRLLESMLGNAGLPALLATLSEATGLRAAVLDEYLALQACSPDEPRFRQLLGESVGAVVKNGGPPDRGARAIAVGVVERGVTWSGQLYPLQIGSTWAGYLGLLGDASEPGDLDRLLADRVATLVALELAKQRTVAEATQRGRGELLDDLLDGNFATDEAALARAQQLGYDLLSPHLIFMLGADAGKQLEGVRDASLGTTRQRRRFADVARAAVLRIDARALVVEREGSIVALLPSARATDPLAAVEQVEQVRVAVVEALSDTGISAGVGSAVAQPRELAAGHREALHALSAARRLLGGDRTVHYGLIGIERLLVHLLDLPELEKFAADALGELLTYDLHHRSELVHTLDVFLRCNGNHVRAAQELHLHRNTLLYRLERAREILGCDLEDADSRLTLQVALRIRKTISPPALQAARPARRAGRAGRRRVS